MDFLLWLQGIRTPLVENVMLGATYLGDQIVVVAVMCLLLWCVDRKFAIRLAFVFFLGGMTCQLLKLIFAVPRPWLLDARIEPVAAALRGATGWSFPSGHTASAVALYGGLFLQYKRWPARVACVLAVALVALSRLALGVHTPADVLTSLAVGVALLALAWYALTPGRRFGQGIMLGASLGLIAALLCAVLVRYASMGMREEIHDGILSLGAAAGFLVGWLIARGRDYPAPRNLPVGIAVYVAGIAVVAAIKFSTGFHWLAEAAGYALLALFAVALYPMLLSKLYAKGRTGRHERPTDADAG